jgi:hypothetical protein
VVNCAMGLFMSERFQCVGDRIADEAFEYG